MAESSVNIVDDRLLSNINCLENLLFIVAGLLLHNTLSNGAASLQVGGQTTPASLRPTAPVSRMRAMCLLADCVYGQGAYFCGSMVTLTQSQHLLPASIPHSTRQKCSYLFIGSGACWASSSNTPWTGVNEWNGTRITLKNTLLPGRGPSVMSHHNTHLVFCCRSQKYDSAQSFERGRGTLVRATPTTATTDTRYLSRRPRRWLPNCDAFGLDSLGFGLL
jgi:hypothetical protein